MVGYVPPADYETRYYKQAAVAWTRITRSPMIGTIQKVCASGR